VVAWTDNGRLFQCDGPLLENASSPDLVFGRGMS